MDVKPSKRIGTAARTLALAAVVVAGATLVASAPRLLRGPRFGHLVERMLPATRGRVRVGGGRWSWKTAVAILRERPADLWLEDIRVLDPEGNEVLQIRRLFARVELHRAARRLVIRDLELDGISFRVATSTSQGVGLVAALAPAAETRDDRAFSLSIPNAHLYRLNATFELEGWGLSLDGIRGLTASLSYVTGPGGPPAFSFEVAGAEVRDGGRLRVGPVGDAWTLPFSRVRLERVATTRDAPDAVRVEASDLVTGRAISTLAATFHGVYTLPGNVSPGIDLQATCTGAADAVNAIIASRNGRSKLAAGGPDASLSLKLAGPYERLEIDGEARAFTVGYRGLRLEDVGFRLAATPSEGRLRLRGLSIGSPGVGRLTGSVSLKSTDGVVAVRDVALVFARPEAAPGPRVIGVHGGARARGPDEGELPIAVSGLSVGDGTLEIPRLAAPFWGGRLVARGRLTAWDRRHARWLPSPLLDLSLDVRHVALERVLGGAAFARGDVSFHARVRGPLWSLTFELDFRPRETLTVLGERFRFPRRTSFLLTEGSIFVHADMKSSRGSSIEATGRIGLAGKLGVDLDIDEFPLERLPGVDQLPLTLTGPIRGHLRLAGPLDAPTLAGNLSFERVTVNGYRLGHGALAITTEPSGDLRARGSLVDGIVVDGTLSSGPAGPRGRLALDIQRLPLDPFISTLPGGLAVKGMASGTLLARIAPGQPSSLDGQLSALTLAVAQTAGGKHARGATAVELRAAGPIAVSARSGDGAISVGPARFAGETGAFELTARSRGGALTGSLRGRLELGAFAPLVAPWIVRPTGSLEVALRAALDGAGRPSLVGDVVVATPVAFRLADQPFSASIRSGRVQLAGHRLETKGLPVVFDTQLLPTTAISRADGSVRIDASVRSEGRTSAFRARLDVDQVRLSVPSLGRFPVTMDGGRIEMRGDALTAEATSLVDVDVPLRGQVRRVRTSIGVVDRAAFDLRLRGIPRRTLALSGDIDVIAARLRADALSASSAGAPPSLGSSSPPELRDARLDLRIRSRGGVEVELPTVPDVRLDLDVHVGGTEGQPVLSGQVRPAGAYSAVLMMLHRLFR